MLVNASAVFPTLARSLFFQIDSLEDVFKESNRLPPIMKVISLSLILGLLILILTFSAKATSTSTSRW